MLGTIAAPPQRTQKYKQRGQHRQSRATRVPLMADAENVTRWIVDQQFRDTQIQLGIPLGEFPHANAQLHIYYTLIDKMQNSVLILVLCFFMTVICLY